jgi:hypothetical protein
MTDTLHQSEPITHRFEKILNRNVFVFPIPPGYFYPLIHTQNFFAGENPSFCTIVVPAEQKPAKLAWIML